MGSLIIPYLETNETHYLSSGTIDTFELSRDELAQFLSLEVTPVVVENELRWSDELDVASL
jgi:hypothetical protein